MADAEATIESTQADLESTHTEFASSKTAFDQLTLEHTELQTVKAEASSTVAVQVTTINELNTRLTEQTSGHTEEITAIRASLEEREQQCVTLTAAGVAFEARVEALSAELTETTTAVDAATEHNQLLSEKIAQQEEQFEQQQALLTGTGEQLQTEIARLQEDIVIKNTAIDDEKAAVSSLTEEVSRITEQLESTEGQVATLTDTSEMMQTRIAELNEQIVDKNSAVNAEKTAVAALNEDLRRIATELGASQGQVSSLTSRGDEIQTEVTQLKQQVAEKEAVIDAEEAAVAGLNEKVSQVSAELELSKGQVGVLTDVAAKSQDEIAELKDQIAAKDAAISAERAAVAGLNEETRRISDEFEQQQARLTDNGEQLQADIARLQEKSAGKDAIIDAEKAAAAGLNEEIRRISIDLEASQSHVSALTDAGREIKGEIAVLKEQIANKDADLDAEKAEVFASREKNNELTATLTFTDVTVQELRGEISDLNVAHSKVLAAKDAEIKAFFESGEEERQRMMALEAANMSLTTNFKQSADAVSDVKSNIDHLENELTTERSNAGKFKAAIAAGEAKVLELGKLNLLAEQRAVKLRADREEERQGVEQKNTELATKVQEMIAACDTLEAKLEEAKSANEDLAGELAETKGAEAQAAMDSSHVEQIIKELKSLQESSKAASKQSEQQVSGLRAKLDQHEAQVATLKEVNVQLRLDVEQSQLASATGMEDALRQAQADYDGMSKQNADLESAMAAMENQQVSDIQRLKDHLEMSAEECGALQEKYEATAKELALLTAEGRKVQSAKEQLEKDLAEADQSSASFTKRGASTDIQQQNEELIFKCSELESVNEDQFNTIQKLKSGLERQSDKIEQLQRDVVSNKADSVSFDSFKEDAGMLDEYRTIIRSLESELAQAKLVARCVQEKEREMEVELTELRNVVVDGAGVVGGTGAGTSEVQKELDQARAELDQLASEMQEQEAEHATMLTKYHALIKKSGKTKMATRTSAGAVATEALEPTVDAAADGTTQQRSMRADKRARNITPVKQRGRLQANNVSPGASSPLTKISRVSVSPTAGPPPSRPSALKEVNQVDRPKAGRKKQTTAAMMRGGASGPARVPRTGPSRVLREKNAAPAAALPAKRAAAAAAAGTGTGEEDEEACAVQ